MNILKRRDFITVGVAGSGLLARNGIASSKVNHHHLNTVELKPDEAAILKRGMKELITLTEGLSFKPMPAKKYPYPLSLIAYDKLPEPNDIRRDIKSHIDSSPVGVLEHALALLELYAVNQPGIERIVPDDGKFFSDAFNTKRLNGWIAVLGETDGVDIESAVNNRWKFRFFREGGSVVGLYVLLNMLVRYARTYGRTRHGEDHLSLHYMNQQCPGKELDTHGITHFIDELCPGLLICRGRMSDLDVTLSLMAMKIGVPAIVPSDYPIPLGKTIRTDSLDKTVDDVIMFPNIRRLLDIPDLPMLPSYLDPRHLREKIQSSETWGGTPESFYILHKGSVTSEAVKVTGDPTGPMGVIITVDAEPMDAFDCDYIELSIVNRLSMMSGVKADYSDGTLILKVDPQKDFSPERIGETLVAAVLHDFPRIRKAQAEIIFDKKTLTDRAQGVKTERETRRREMSSTTEESMDRFYSCVGCSAFAPNHMCVITPERTPQCGRPFEMIKTGALYQYDDMTSIHHNIQHRMINSFQTFDKGVLLDAVRGEWSGANEQIRRMTHGRTGRVLLHTLRDAPHTGCGCFGIILFETGKPRLGIGIMGRNYKGMSPDGRTWNDLHFIVGGKQSSGYAACSTGYLRSKKFLQADGGWRNVVWVSPDIAKIMGDNLPESIKVG